MASRNRVVIVNSERYVMRLALEFDEVNELWRVIIYYRRGSKSEWQRSLKGEGLYAELSANITIAWVDRVRRDLMAACINVNCFEY